MPKCFICNKNAASSRFTSKIGDNYYHVDCLKKHGIKGFIPSRKHRIETAETVLIQATSAEEALKWLKASASRQLQIIISLLAEAGRLNQGSAEENKRQTIRKLHEAMNRVEELENNFDLAGIDIDLGGGNTS